MAERRTNLSGDELQRLEAFYARFPGWKKRWDLVAEYALARGGLALEFWELKMGPAFGKSTRWSVEACADQLGVPLSQVVEIFRETFEWVEPKVRADPDWQKLQQLGHEGRVARLVELLERP